MLSLDIYDSTYDSYKPAAGGMSQQEFLKTIIGKYFRCFYKS